MINQTNVQVTITLQDQTLEDGKLQEETRILLQQIKDMDGVEKAGLVAVENPPKGSKALGGYLIGMLTAEVNPENIKVLMRFIGDRLFGKTIEMEVEANGKKLKVKASSQKELMAAIESAKKFLAEGS